MQTTKPVQSWLSTLLMFLMALPAPTLLAAEDAVARANASAVPMHNEPVVLTGIDVEEAPQTTVITVRGNTAPTFTTYRLDKPTRVFIDIAGANVAAITEPKAIGNGVVRTVDAVPFRRGNASYGRIIVTFDQDALYHVRADGNAVVVVVDGTDRKLDQAQTAQITANDQAAKNAATRERQLLEQLRASHAKEQAAASELQKLQAELTATNQLGQATEAQKLKLQKAQSDLAAEQKDAAQLRNELNAERASLAAVVAQRRSEEARIELLRAKIAELQKNKTDKDNSQVSVLQADLDRARKQAEQLREEIRQVSESRRQAQVEEMAHLKTILAQKDAELAQVRGNKDAQAKAKAVALQQELAAAKAQLSDSQKAADRAARADTERETSERKWRQAEDRALVSEKALAQVNQKLNQTNEALTQSRAEAQTLAQQKREAEDRAQAEQAQAQRLAAQKQASDARAEQVAQLLQARQKEVESVRAALQERESALASQLDQARIREQAAVKAGRQAEAQAAAAERAQLEQGRGQLQKELVDRQHDLEIAQADAKRNGQARQQAEEEAKRLRADLADREKTLAQLQLSKDAASQKKLADAEAKVAAARQQVEAQLAQRDLQLRSLEAQLQAQLQQSRAELARSQAELANSKTELEKAQAQAQAQKQRAQAQEAQAQRLAAQKQASDARAEQVAQLLQARQKEVESVRAALQERESALASQLDQARIREQAAVKAGRQAEAQAAAAERAQLEQGRGQLQKELVDRQHDLEIAQADAKRNGQARQQAEEEAKRLRADLADREKTLAQLQLSKDAASQKKLADAEAKVAAARQQVEAQLAQRDLQLRSLEAQLQAQLQQSRAELARSQAELANSKTELEKAQAQAQAQKQRAQAQEAHAQELAQQKQASDARAEEVARLLQAREKEVESVRAALQAREQFLSQELAQAREREQAAAKLGRKEEADVAAADRARLEQNRKQLQGELQSQQRELDVAKADAARNVQAREQAEAQAAQLRTELAQREAKLAELRQKSDAKSQQEVAQAEARVAATRAKLTAELAQRDAQLQHVQTQAKQQLAWAQQAAQVQAAELAKARTQIMETEKRLAQAREQQVVQAKKAEEERARAERMSSALQARESELAQLRVSLQERESKMKAQVQQAQQVERNAQKAGNTEALDKARGERAQLQKAQAALQRELTDQHTALSQAQAEAKHNAEARKRAEQQAKQLSEQLAQRQHELALAQQKGQQVEAQRAQHEVAQAQARLAQQKAQDEQKMAAQEAEFDGKLQQMRSEMQKAHDRELARVQAERTDQAQQAQQREARVQGLLQDRETQLKQLQDEMHVREATLAAQLAEARQREDQARSLGQSAAANQAAQERQGLETAMNRLQSDLKSREEALQAAAREVQAQAQARAKAEQEVQRLAKALSDQETALQTARHDQAQRDGADRAAAQKAVAQAEARVAQARQEQQAALAQRDGEMHRLELDTQARVAQVRAELAAEHKQREAALARQYQHDLAAEKADRIKSDAQAANQRQRMSSLLAARESELKNLKTELQTRLEHLNDQLAAAKQREQKAQSAGRKQEAAAAGREHKALLHQTEFARKTMAQRDQDLAQARQDAQAEQKARAKAEARVAELSAAMAARADELESLRGDTSSKDKIAAAERAVADAKGKVDAAEKAAAQQNQRTEERVGKEIERVKRELEVEHAAREQAMQDQYASRERELQGQLVAEQTRRRQAEMASVGHGRGDDEFLRKQQQRIAVLESRTERERQARTDNEKATEAESRRVAELEAKLQSERAEKARQTKELEQARQRTAQAEQQAEQAKQSQRIQEQKQLVHQEDQSLRRDAEQERQRARAARNSDASNSRAMPVQVQDIHITAEGKRRGRIEIPMSGDAQTGQVEVIARTENRVVLRLTGAQLPERLQRAFDTKALQGPMERVTAFQAEGAREETRIVVDLAGPSSDRFAIRDGKLIWDFDRLDGSAPSDANRAVAGAGRGSAAVKSGGEGPVATPQPAQAAAEDFSGGGASSAPEGANYDPIKAPWRKSRRYTGKRINLTIKDADIQHVLTFLAKEGKVNIIAGPEVSGKVTFHLENIPWDLALDVILKARGLDYVRQSGVIRVAPVKQLQDEFNAEVERRQKAEEVKPLVVRIVPINYGDAKAMVNQVKDVLSTKGKASVDERTNSIVVKDTEEHAAAVEEMIRKLDAQTPQVLIEARVVEASSTFTREIGVQWGGNFAQSSVYGNETGLKFPSVVGVGGGADGTSPDIHGVAITTPNYAVNMPAAVGAGSGGALGLTLGSLGGAGNLNLRLSAAEQEGVVKIVSSPKVLTLNNSTATIKQGIQIPISVVSAAGVSTRFFNADLKLQATPHITQDGNIKMNIDIQKAEPDFSNRAADGNPTVTSRSALTELLLSDGETTVIGGIYTRTTSTGIKKVPFFGDIPLLGALFRNRNEQDKRTELLIFITPRIVNRAAAMTVGK